ncbi:hypothetical protein GF1_15320 [Desulfolithobacter dissulfuricans]|uniref:Uncharacterized protein n=1 Tax=Desulfolithobacter dissulfuricans TaxID=2795293 RepID=A0A915U9P7_9BACT|nr:hypothetical protein GF1_15320 [Desulfolithobacter dissulfuricans]
MTIGVRLRLYIGALVTYATIEKVSGREDKYQSERRYTMGDKGGKKDKDKSKKQKIKKQEQKAKRKQDKQQKRTP